MVSTQINQDQEQEVMANEMMNMRVKSKQVAPLDKDSDSEDFTRSQPYLSKCIPAVMILF